MKQQLIAASLLVWVAGTSQQGLSSEDVAAAIAQGRDGKTLEKKCKANGQNVFDIVVEGPVGRIMRAAREAKKEDREFSAADVTPALGGPVLTVTVRRDAGLNRLSAVTPMLVPAISILPDGAPDGRTQEWLTMGGSYRPGIAVRSKRPGPDGPILLKPISSDIAGGSFGNSWNGAKRTRIPLPDHDMEASFDLAAFRAMPQGDVEVVAFMTDVGERTCKISDKDRSAIR